MRYSVIFAGAIAANVVSAHGNHDLNQELAVRQAMLQHTSRSVGHCAAKMKTRGLEARAVERRARKMNDMIKARGLKGV
jgi:hypothetical protein